MLARRPPYPHAEPGRLGAALRVGHDGGRDGPGHAAYQGYL